MSTAFAESGRVVLHDVSWAAYQSLRKSSSNGRFTYDRGTLEIMSPSLRHESRKSRLARLVEVFTEERDIPLRAAGSTTLDREDLARGMEGGESFYLGDDAGPENWDELDLSVDPPPTLLIEIEVSHSSLDKLSICAAMGIREVWRHRDGQLCIPCSRATGRISSPSKARFSRSSRSIRPSSCWSSSNSATPSWPRNFGHG